MNNAEARSDLRAMLEYQIREKEAQRATEASAKEKIYQHNYILKDPEQSRRDLENQKI